MDKPLIGTWKSDAIDAATMEAFGNVTMEFREDGQLIYTFINGDKEQRMILTYQVEGSTIITDQPSSPQKERSEFKLTDNRLELTYEGVKSKYIRIE